MVARSTLWPRASVCSGQRIEFSFMWTCSVNQDKRIPINLTRPELVDSARKHLATYLRKLFRALLRAPRLSRERARQDQECSHCLERFARKSELVEINVVRSSSSFVSEALEPPPFDTFLGSFQRFLFQ